MQKNKLKDQKTKSKKNCSFLIETLSATQFMQVLEVKKMVLCVF